MILHPDRRRALTAKAQSYAANVEQVMPYLKGRGFSREAADMFGLGYVTEGEMQGRLSIPYLTHAGVVQIKYRRVEGNEDSPKYLYEAGTGLYLYNAQVLLNTPDMVVVAEGELDAVSVQAYCGIPAVAYPGVDTWQKQKHWRMCFEGIQTVVVVADGDKPGHSAARRVAESIGYSARVVDMPPGQDANSFIASESAGAFMERIK